MHIKGMRTARDKKLMLVFRPTVPQRSLSCICQVWPAFHPQPGDYFHPDSRWSCSCWSCRSGWASSWWLQSTTLAPSSTFGSSWPQVGHHFHHHHIGHDLDNLHHCLNLSVILFWRWLWIRLWIDYILNLDTNTSKLWWWWWWFVNLPKVLSNTSQLYQSQTATSRLPTPPPTSSTSSWSTSSSTAPSTSPWNWCAGRTLQTGWDKIFRTLDLLKSQYLSPINRLGRMPPSSCSSALPPSSFSSKGSLTT